MMPLLFLLLLTAWTLVLLRLLGARATLSERTYLTYLLLGASLGVLAMPMVRLLFAPYGEFLVYQRLLISLGWQAVLLLPVLNYLFRNGVYRVVSVADAFLLAFVTGFGFDLFSVLLASTTATASIQGLSYFPPFVFARPEYAGAGYGYWTGLVALGAAAMARFVRRRKLTFAVTVVLFLWVTLDQMSLFWPPAPDSLIQSLAGFVRTVTLQGQLTGWVALAGLVGLSIYESVWVSRRGAAPGAKFELLEEHQELFTVLVRRRFRRYARLKAFFGLRRQARIAQAECQAAANNEKLRAMAAHAERRRQQADPARAERGGEAVPTEPRLPFWRGRLVRHLSPWVALVILIFLLPKIWAAAANYFWTTRLLHFQLGGFPGLLNVVLMAILLYRYFVSADKPDSSADDVVRFRGEKGLLWVGLAAVLLVFFYGSVQSLYPPPNWLVGHARLSWPPWTPTQLATLLLLFAVAATTLTVERSVRWRRAPLPERRAAAVRQGLRVGPVLLVAWICLTVYTPAVQLLHQKYGGFFFETAQDLYPQNVGAMGNYAAATVVTVLSVALAYGVHRLLRIWARRIEAFFVKG